MFCFIIFIDNLLDLFGDSQSVATNINDDSSIANVDIMFDSNSSQQLEHIFQASKGNSTNKNENAARIHFQWFYTKQYYPNANNKSNLRQTLTLDDITFEEVTNDLFGKFATYLCNDAKNLKNKNTDLSYGTISIYMSSIRMLLVKRFLSDYNKYPDLLKLDIWSMYLSKIRKIKVQHSIKNNKPLSKSIESASEEDVMAMFNCIVWDNDCSSAEFLLLFMSCIVHCGRGSEVRNILNNVVICLLLLIL